MKKMVFLVGLCVVLFGGGQVLAGDPLEELLEEFNKQYEAIKPPSQFSSVGSDYKLGQAALGTLYTTKAIGLLYKQNREILEKYNEMLRKYDKVIEQNREIIKILSQIAKNQERLRASDNSESRPEGWSDQ